MARKDEPAPARYNPYRISAKVMAGRRFVVRESPAEALERARAALLRHGFTPWKGDLAPILEAEGSPWSVVVTRIGASRGAWVTNAMFNALPIPGMRPVVAPTFGVAAARRLADGTTELVVMPRETSSSTALEIVLDAKESSAAEFFLPALDEVQGEYEAEGRLVDLTRRAYGHPDKSSPVNARRFKKLLKAAK